MQYFTIKEGKNPRFLSAKNDEKWQRKLTFGTSVCSIESERLYSKSEVVMAKKKVKWVRPRHIFVRNVLAPFVLTYTKITYGVKIEPFKEEGDRQYLVISNHQTGFDQFFVEAAFKKHIYFIATEDLL